MPTSQFSGASGAPSPNPEALQAVRIASRINVSAAVAGVMAGIAWGAERRDHGAMLAGLVADRTASSWGDR